MVSHHPPSYLASNARPQEYSSTNDRPNSMYNRNSSYSFASTSTSSNNSENTYTPSTSIHNMILDSDTSDLPSYSVGADVQPITVKNALSSLLKINVANSQPTYDIGDILYGTILFAPRKEVLISDIYIVLEGEEAAVKSGWTSDVYLKRGMKLGYHVVPSSALPADGKAIPGYLYSFPFSLQIPEFGQASGCKEGILEHSRLPPSLGSPPELVLPQNNLPDNAVRITYRLRAGVKIPDLSSGGTKIHCNAISFVYITPSYSLAPNALQRVHRSPRTICTDLKRNLLKRSVKGSLELHIPDIPSLPLTSVSATTIPLMISFLPSKEDASSPPPLVHLISTKLIARTISASQSAFTTTPPTECPESTSMYENKFSLSRISPKSTPWTLDMFKASRCNSKAAYSAAFQLPLWLPKSKLIVPTFESCIVARDYSLIITVYMQDKTMFSISVPVNVISTLAPRSNLPFGDSYSSTSMYQCSLPHYSQPMRGPPSAFSPPQYPTSSNASADRSGHYSYLPYPTGNNLKSGFTGTAF